MTTFRLLCSTALIAALLIPIQCTSRGIEMGAAIAQPKSSQPRRIRWTPQRRMGSVRNTISGGRRGQLQAICDVPSTSQPTMLALLVPKEQDGLYTTAAQPSLFWQVNTSQAVSARFILSDPAIAEPVFTQTLPIRQTGIAQVTIPPTVALKAGTQYRWTVILACRNGAEIHARSFVQRLDATMVPVGSQLEQAIAYAKAGIWYDALHALMQAYREDSSNGMVQAELKSLLTQSGNRALAPSAQGLPLLPPS